MIWNRLSERYAYRIVIVNYPDLIGATVWSRMKAYSLCSEWNDLNMQEGQPPHWKVVHPGE
jgi:hypothetical protein